MIYRHRWLAAFALTLLMALLMAEPVPAGWFNRGNPLLKMNVVQWPEDLCTQEWSKQTREWTTGDAWTEISWEEKLEALDGIAWEKGLDVRYRACCVCRDGFDCDKERACEEMGEVPWEGPAGAIYNVSGSPYSPEHVAGWNAAHAPQPTATPVPPPPGPVLGACCFDFEKPWICGQALEGTCMNQGGVKWVSQRECSTEICSNP